MSTTRGANSARMGVALIVMVLYAATLAILSYVPLPAENKDAFMLLAGNIGPLVGAVVAYYFNIPGGKRAGDGSGNGS